jgi:hypothetical protein
MKKKRAHINPAMAREKRMQISVEIKPIEAIRVRVGLLMPSLTQTIYNFN